MVSLSYPFYRISEIGIQCRYNLSNREQWRLFSPEQADRKTEQHASQQTDRQTDIAADIIANVISPELQVYALDFLEPKFREHIALCKESILFSSGDWSYADIYSQNENDMETLILIQLISFLSDKRGLLLHSSLIDYHNHGILFAGPSGIGKTTQAELWNRWRGADIINGDRVFAREKEGCFYAYGSPWHGSSPYCLNRSVPVTAIVLLKQAEDDTIRICSDEQKLAELMPQVFLPQWDAERVGPCLDTLDALLTKIPVYVLECRPDEDAVTLLEETLKESGLLLT